MTKLNTKTRTTDILVMPYTRIVGQEDLKLALELSFINERIGGVLIEGERGTAKSTTVRAFSLMMTGALPVTLPINATEDRVIGGWQLDRLLKGEKVWQKGLLQQAAGGFLYIDEVNLLDDHIVNLLLDASSTNILVIQRDNEDRTEPISFKLIGTMNPEEGELRPQLLDRFGLCVQVAAEEGRTRRRMILQAILDFDRAPQQVIKAEQARLNAMRKRLVRARARVEGGSVGFPAEVADLCVSVAQGFQAEGHRGDHVLALAAQSLAALAGDKETGPEHVRRVARMALQHRLIAPETRERLAWKDDILEGLLHGESSGEVE